MRKIQRNALALISGGVVAVLTLTACTAGGGTKSGAVGDTSTLRMAFYQDISTPDPDTAYNGSELNLVNSAYEGLVGYEPGNSNDKITGVLATSWTEKDNTVFTFKLRKGVTFHDGTSFTSAAIKASFDRRTAVGQGPAYMVAGVKDVATPDPNTAVITLKEPNTAFLPLLASPFGPKMVSPTAIKAHAGNNGTSWFANHDAGTGPYTYGQFDKGTSYQLNRYANYWGPAPAYKTVNFSVVTSQSSLQLQLQGGQLDGLTTDLDKLTRAAYDKEPSLKVTTWASTLNPTLFVNPKSALFTDAGTRRKFLSGIDLSTLVSDALGGIAKPSDGVFPAAVLPAALNKKDLTYTASAWREFAATLNNRTIKIGYATPDLVAKALSDNLVAELGKAGIKAQSIGFGTGTYYTAMSSADAPDLTIFNGFPDTVSPEAWARVFYTPTGGLDLFGASVPGMDTLLDDGLRTGNPDAYAQVVQQVNGSGLWFSLASLRGTAIFSTKVAGADKAFNPVITGLIDYAKLEPTR